MFPRTEESSEEIVFVIDRATFRATSAGKFIMYERYQRIN